MSCDNLLPVFVHMCSVSEFGVSEFDDHLPYPISVCVSFFLLTAIAKYCCRQWQQLLRIMLFKYTKEQWSRYRDN